MINVAISIVIIITTMLATWVWILMFTSPLNSLQAFNCSVLFSDKIQEAAKMQFMINNCTLNWDKNITLLHHQMPHNSTHATFNTTLWQLERASLEIKETLSQRNVKMYNNYRYEINKSNDESSLKKSTPFKIVNSSPLPRAAAAAAGIWPTNSKHTESSNFERIEMQESVLRSENEKLLLHRNKRYLVFPEGSSFQLVFDLIIPIVDYTNFAIMGITCAVAWELPSKPPSEIIDNFRTKLNDGLNRRNDTALQSLVYINSQRTEQQTTEGKKRWWQGVAEAHNQNLPQLSATTATTSGREHFLAYAPKPPLLQPSSSFSHSDYTQRASNHQQPLSFPFGPQHPNYDYETFDENQRKTLHANRNVKSPMHRNEFNPNVKNYVYYKSLGPQASKWNFQNWRQKAHQLPKERYNSHSDEDSYFNKDNWGKPTENYIEKFSQKPQTKWKKYRENPQVKLQKRLSSERMGRSRIILNKLPRHRIYPIFGKRRRRQSSGDHQNYFVSNGMAKEMHDVHTKEHLNTRLKLFTKIEKLYKTRGQNGTACILRALCETERMHLGSNNEIPQSFVMELLRSIFTLPLDVLTNSSESLVQVDNRYVNAVIRAHDSSQTCSQQYGDCVYSITYDT